MEAAITPPMGTSRILQYRKILMVRHLTDTTFILRFERGEIDFQAGQYLSVGPKGDINMREYSIYSSTDAPFLEILVKEVESGYVSRKLKALKPGDMVYVEGPFGFFTLPQNRFDNPVYCIATGTGISPFHCFATSPEPVDYHIIHGTGFTKENYEHQEYDSDKIVHCVSRDSGGDYHGRVTDYLKKSIETNNLALHGLFYLCGNCDMIYEVYDILTTAGVGAKQIFAEVYF